MATVRVEIIGIMQLIWCESCNWGTIGAMPGKCPNCGVQFNQVRLSTSKGECVAEDDLGPFLGNNILR